MSWVVADIARYYWHCVSFKDIDSHRRQCVEWVLCWYYGCAHNARDLEKQHKQLQDRHRSASIGAE
jgi:hypothetical protein